MRLPWDLGPIITAVNITSGDTTFSANNTGLGLVFAPPGREVGVSTTTVSGTVAATGILAHITLDTTGVLPGEYPWLLTSPFLGPTDVALDPGFDAILQDGLLYVIPEPSAIVLGLFAAAGLGAVAIRNQRARRVAKFQALKP